jgi:hypothetical protein
VGKRERKIEMYNNWLLYFFSFPRKDEEKKRSNWSDFRVRMVKIALELNLQSRKSKVHNWNFIA